MLYDADFLKKLDEHREKTTYARVISLDLDENPIEQVEGRITQGSINVDGASAVRRTCSLTMVAQDVNINEYYWGLNTKFKLDIGVENRVDDSYPKIIWFKMGTYVITSFNTSLATNAYTIQLQGKDKMCLLNGDVGGVINATTDFGTYDFYDKETGITTNYKLPIKQILWDAVHAYANEPFHNIVLNDLDELGLELLEYRYDIPLYLIRQADSDVYHTSTLDGNTVVYLKRNSSTGALSQSTTIGALEHYDRLISSMIGNEQTPTTFYMEGGEGLVFCAAKIEYGQTAGYHTCELVYAGDLIANIGESVTSVFDKIKNMLGQFEYFYDLDGRFIFQRQKSLVNTVWTPQRRDGDNELYVEALALASNSIYNFNGSILISSFQNNPNLLNLRNDYTVWGVRKGISGSDIPIHMRYAIDNKPYRYVDREGTVWTSLSEEEVNAENASKAIIRTRADIYAAWENFEHDPELYPNGLADTGWWNIGEWAEYYKILFQEYPGKSHPDDEMRYYCAQTSSYLPVAAAYYQTASGTPTDTVELLFYKKLVDGQYEYSISFYPHGRCYHTFAQFKEIEDYVNKGILPEGGDFSDPMRGNKASIDRMMENGLYKYLAYCYEPRIPEDKREAKFRELEDTIEYDDPYKDHYHYNMDWREIIYRMALDYRRYNHDDDFEIILSHMNDPLYPRGITGYEQYYTDLEGFWRQLYYPTFDEDELKKQLEYEFTLYRDIQDKTKRNGIYVKGYYKPIGTKIGTIAEEKLESSKTYLRDSFGKYYYCNPNVRYYYSTTNGITFVANGNYSSNGQLGSSILASESETKKFMDYVSKGRIYTREIPDVTSLYCIKEGQMIPFMDKFNYVDDTIEHYLKVTDSTDPQNPKYELIDDSTQQLSSQQKAGSYVMTAASRQRYRGVLTQIENARDCYAAVNDLEEQFMGYKATHNNVGIVFTYNNMLNGLNSSYTGISTYSSTVKNLLTTNGALGRQGVSVLTKLSQAANYQTQIKEAQTIQKEILQYIEGTLEPQLTQASGNVEYQLFSEYVMDSNNGLRPTLSDAYMYDAYNLCAADFLYAHTSLRNIYWDSTNGELPKDIINYSLNNKGQKLASKKNTAIQYYKAYTDFYGGGDDVLPEYRYWHKNVFEAPQSLNFWFDFLTGDGELRQFTTQAVGDRPKAVNETSVKSIYYRDTPKIIFTSAEKLAAEEPKTGYNYFVLPEGYENMFSISSQGKDAKNRIDELLYQYSYCTESATIQAIPIYYLDVNKRIHIYDDESGIDGDYVVSKISFPLSYNGMMSITATKAPENSVTEREE